MTLTCVPTSRSIAGAIVFERRAVGRGRGKRRCRTGDGTEEREHLLPATEPTMRKSKPGLAPI